MENCPATVTLKGRAHRTQGLVFCSMAGSFTSVKKFIMFLEENKNNTLGKINLMYMGRD